MNCEEEANHDDHDHNHDHGHSHGATSDETWDRGAEFSLYKFVDKDKARVLNATTNEVTCFKPWDERLTENIYIESDADDQLLIFVPFTGSVTLKAIRVIGGRNGSYPTSMKVFINRDDIDFDIIESLQATQEWNLVEDFQASAEYQTKIAKFQNVNSLTFFFPHSVEGDRTRVSYIGLKGDYKQAIRQAVITVYEATPNIADHKTQSDSLLARNIQ